MSDADDIPDHRKGAILDYAHLLGMTDDATLLTDRTAAGLPWSADFLTPIMERINAKMAGES